MNFDDNLPSTRDASSDSFGGETGSPGAGVALIFGKLASPCWKRLAIIKDVSLVLLLLLCCG
jgi:hypothetical protein